MKRKLTSYLLAAVAALSLGADGSCDDPILENNGFDLWCGDQLCFWEVESGSVAKVPTWHAADFGIELIGNSAAISQQSGIGSGIECLRVHAVANIDETAEVTVEVDFFDDGVVDAAERIPTSDWAPVTVLITAPDLYDGARFRIKKLGSGTARLAELVVESADKCVDPPPEIVDRPLGAVCLEGGQCASGICDLRGFFAGTCSECSDSAECSDGVCGLQAPESRVLGLYRGCTPAGTDAAGAICHVDGECASGYCDGVCSGCRSATDCGGDACIDHTVQVGDDQSFTDLGQVCEASKAPGDPCTYDIECSSGECAGAERLRVCDDDRRSCETSDDCYGDTLCVTVGTAGGSCR